MTQVTRYLVLLALSFCICSSSWAARVPARILLGTSEAPLSPAPVQDGAGVLAPLQILKLLGANYAASDDGVDLVVSAASGDTASIGTIDVDGTRMVPMDKVMGLIGGERRWDASKRTLTLLAHLNSVEFENDTLKINCSFPVHASAKLWDGKIAVDVANTKVASEAREVFIGAPVVSKARLGQYNDRTARVVLELNKPTGCKVETEGSASQIVVKVGDGLVPAPARLTTASTQPAKGRPFTINSVAVQTVNERAFNIVIGTSGKATAWGEVIVSPPSARIDLPAGRLADSCEVTGAHPLVHPELTKTASGARLLLRFTRPMVYGVEVRDTETIVYVHPPDKSGGTLAGKLVAIDPGHGGKDPGAPGGGYHEKDVNYKIAKELAAALEKQGARTILTRNTDVYVGLPARSEIAMNAEADFFISVHCNSNPKPNSASGILTFFHMQEPSPKLLAQAIHDSVCKSTGMCDLGARSDRTRFTTGACVLRTLKNSGIPGVLIECGYLNNQSDRAKLLDTEYRSKLIGGVVSGLKAYIEGTPIE